MLVAPRGRETHPGPWESCNIQSYKMQHLSFLRCLHNQIEIKTASSFLDKNYTLYWMLYWKHRPAVGKISRNPAVCWQPLFFPSSVAEARYVTELLHLVLPHSLVTLQPTLHLHSPDNGHGATGPPPPPGLHLSRGCLVCPVRCGEERSVQVVTGMSSLWAACAQCDPPTRLSSDWAWSPAGPAQVLLCYSPPNQSLQSPPDTAHCPPSTAQPGV